MGGALRSEVFDGAQVQACGLRNQGPRQALGLEVVAHFAHKPQPFDLHAPGGLASGLEFGQFNEHKRQPFEHPVAVLQADNFVVVVIVGLQVKHLVGQGQGVDGLEAGVVLPAAQLLDLGVAGGENDALLEIAAPEHLHLHHEDAAPGVLAWRGVLGGAGSGLSEAGLRTAVFKIKRSGRLRPEAHMKKPTVLPRWVFSCVPFPRRCCAVWIAYFFSAGAAGWAVLTATVFLSLPA